MRVLQGIASEMNHFSTSVEIPLEHELEGATIRFLLVKVVSFRKGARSTNLLKLLRLLNDQELTTYTGSLVYLFREV